jgi:hypothetical protein
MEGISLSSNQNQSKTLGESERKALREAIFEYALYLSRKGDALERVLKNVPQALPSLSELIEKLEKFGKCKSFLTNDPETLQACIDEYNFKRGILKGIYHYNIKKRTPEEIEKFIEGLENLAKGDEQVIRDLYNIYLRYKTTPIPKEDIDTSIVEVVPAVRAITSLIVRYLEDPEGYGKKLSKYLGIGRKKAEMGKVEIRKELEEVIRNYNLYTSSIINVSGVAPIHIPEVLLSLATLIENLRRWDESNLLTNDPKTLEEYADKYHFMAYFMGSIWKHPPKEIEGFKKGLETLAKGGEEIIDGSYRYYKEVKRTALEEILKYKNYQTISPYELRKAHESARIRAGESIERLLVNYFRNPEEYEDQIMIYVRKPLR